MSDTVTRAQAEKLVRGRKSKCCGLPLRVVSDGAMGIYGFFAVCPKANLIAADPVHDRELLGRDASYDNDKPTW